MTNQTNPSNSENDAINNPTASAEPTVAPRLRSQSQFSREREEDQQEALNSLDQTVLRPPITPISFDETPPAPPQAPTTAKRSHWKLAAAVIVAAGLTTAVTAKALSSRQSNVGLLGVQTVSEKLAAQVDGPVSHDDGTDEQVEEESADTSQVVEEETVYQEDSGEEESSYPDWVYVSPRYNRNSTGDSGEETTYDDGGSSSIDGEPYGLRMDDRGISYRYDGGGVSYDYDTRDITYDYGGGSVTFDSDALDEIERYLEQNDSWDYYDWGYSDSSERDRSRTYDYGPGHGYIGGW
ncbi:MAG: hypothetical protein IJ781_03625 [Atopobiaceae bacterium]|nr:hypothetical protein [Atopobiaceae bacterium]